MFVVMKMGRAWQEAGTERQLRVGERYDLPSVVANGLIATGAAEAVPEHQEERDVRPPETKPFVVTERTMRRSA